MSCQYELLHVGVNLQSEDEALATAQRLSGAFNLPVRQGQKSIFAGTAVECMKSPYLGSSGHIAMQTEYVPAAVDELKAKGFSFREDTAAYSADGELINIYMQEEFGGFAVHIIKKK